MSFATVADWDRDRDRVIEATAVLAADEGVAAVVGVAEVRRNNEGIPTATATSADAPPPGTKVQFRHPSKV